MIKFFRKIRKDLLTKGKTRKYIKYAIGEIVLVVIGILIALQINNWNQERILKNQNRTILQNLNEEFKENLDELDLSIERLDDVIKGLDTLLTIMRTHDITLTEPQFDQLLNKTFWTPNWSPSSFVLEEIRNTGGLSNLQNKNLKSLLFKWEREFERIESNKTIFIGYGAEYIEFITKYGSVRNIDALTEITNNLQRSIIAKNSIELLKNPEFENRADNFYFLAVRSRSFYQSLREIMHDIIEVSNAELK